MSKVRISHVAAVGAGGAIGATLRVAFTELGPFASLAFPIATLAENLLGAFLLGALLVYLLDRLENGRTLYLFACTGILGSFTTFSHLSVDVAEMARDARYASAVLYPLLSVVLGLAAALAGAALGRRSRRRRGSERGGR
jgi:fluoride exporter